MRPHLLVVEDSPTYKGWALLLFGDAYRLTLVDTLSEALWELSQWTPDLILLDLHLPDSHRDDTASAVAQTTRVPILAWTACQPSDEARLRTLVRRAGAVGLLIKSPEDGSWLEPEGRDALVKQLRGWIRGENGGETQEPPRVLFIEDDPKLIEPFGYAARLAIPGVECDSASSVASARAMLRIRDYAVVILDLKLDDSEGLGTLEAIRQHVGLERLMILSGSPEYRELIDALKLDVKIPFLDKPVLIHVLAAEIRKIATSQRSPVDLFNFLAAANSRLERAIEAGSRA